MTDIDIHSVVALLEGLPDEGLVRRQIGTVVENWDPGVYEVEFRMTTEQATPWPHGALSS